MDVDRDGHQERVWLGTRQSKSNDMDIVYELIQVETKLALKIFPEPERSMELERARLAWTCEWFSLYISQR